REVFFRDTAHGFLAWGFATLLSAAVLTSATTALVNGGGTAVGRLASAPATGVLDGYAGLLLLGDESAVRDPVGAAAARTEAARMLRGSLLDDEQSIAQRAYLVQVVAGRTGLSRAQAEQRVAATIAAVKENATAVQRAAAKLSLWLAAA